MRKKKQECVDKEERGKEEISSKNKSLMVAS